MNKKKNVIFFLGLILLVNCSFDTKTGIWTGEENEMKRIIELEKEQLKNKNIKKIYSSKNIYYIEKTLTDKITLSQPKKNLSWKMPGLNNQNFLGNIYLSSVDNKFLKKKIGKNKLSLSKITTPPLIYKNNIFLSDDKGTIFSVDEYGDIIWKKNIYKKIYKKIYKNLTFTIYEDNIYVADNVGFIYAIASDSGKLIWIKNHGVPLKSKIKVFDNKIFLINQDNRLISLSTKNGSIIWNIRSTSSFIKSQNFLSLALSKQGDVIASTSSGELLKVNSINGNVDWSLNTLGISSSATDFFKSSDIVIINESVIFSNHLEIFSYNLNNGYMNWRTKVSSIATPIVDGKNIFFVTEYGYFVIISLETGEIISSTNILTILKGHKRSTKITGFIMGSGKIYSVTQNGYLIASSSTSGKVENYKKIGSPITSSPIINNGKLFIYTEKSRILGFN
jgi:outer membrane protein assembly factor BamB